MITDKLLAFADGKALTATADSDTVDFGKGGDEIARTMNLVVQLDDCSAVTPTTSKVAVTLKGKDADGAWQDVCTFPAVTVADAIAGARLVNFAKLPLNMRDYSALKLNLAVTTEDGDAGTLADAKYSAWLTPSAEQDYKKV